MQAEERRMLLHTLALHEPVTLRGLALVLGQERNQVAQTVEQLVAAGLVQRQRRVPGVQVLLRLTLAGQQALAVDSSL
jgi:DNA-binding MarR family transcriptional regulator